jgi:hypothetical protein
MKLENNDDNDVMLSTFKQFSTKGPIELDALLTRSVEAILASYVGQEDPNYVHI